MAQRFPARDAVVNQLTSAVRMSDQRIDVLIEQQMTYQRAQEASSQNSGSNTVEQYRLRFQRNATHLETQAAACERRIIDILASANTSMSVDFTEIVRVVNTLNVQVAEDLRTQDAYQRRILELEAAAEQGNRAVHQIEHRPRRLLPRPKRAPDRSRSR